ncbi:polysaccharide deacetylase family sporulation protein PdaB [Clostridium ganghwense]|uniref:Polysaccharide deacetylase family sporulation protein PdaB n=1 Tax=Clostridium ganghwense TaxID=312089 RepID=A0ABT4CNF4_9CLOT|nr:polysaccharide deacetylase family sporulation protein PdaB [Clostridium ganghwense]MCY6370577.1 polysaccharide deacetylase family sporulation protein PdaB [Clostridium ganghwense]
MKILVISRRTKVKNILLVLIMLIAVGLIATMFNYRSGGVFTKEKKLPIYCVDTKEKKVAISFDASWGANNTIKILDILDKYNVKATFFLVGRWSDEFPKETKEIYIRGHEIGNHSDTHPDMTTLSNDKIIKEISATDAKLMQLIGTDTKLFRFPSGSYNDKSVEAAESTNHYCVQWDVDSIDWKEQGAESEYIRVINKVKPGSIILFHNTAKYTPENLPKIIEELKSQGYEFVKISDLIYKDNYHIDYTGRQILNN